MVIRHSLSVGVEQLCARSAGAPSVEDLRPRFCTQCGQLARDGGRVRVQGHRLYRRQVCGLSEGWIVVWVRRYLCRECGHTMSRLPDWLHPWRWYAATVIIEALYRHLILQEPARAISLRFGRMGGGEWRSLRRWRGQLLCSPTLTRRPIQAAPENRCTAGARRAATNDLRAVAQSAALLIADTVSPEQIKRLQSRLSSTPEALEAARQAWDRLARGIQRLNAAGVKIGVGTDGGGQTGDQFIGWTMHTEMENMVAAHPNLLS